MAERGNNLLRQLDYWGGIPATAPAALFRRIERRIRAAGRPESASPRIGIICLGAMGDLLLLSALVNGIHQQIPAASIELIVSQANAHAVPLLPHVTAAFQAPATKVQKFVRWLRGRRYDLLLDSSQWARLGALLCAFSGAARTVGFRTRGQWRSCAYDVKVEHSAHRHELENFLALGKAVWPDFQGKPELDFAAIKPDAESVIYCHFHPAAGPGRHLKQWPETHWRDLIAELAGLGHQIRLTGGESDMAANELFLRRHFAHNDTVSSIAGKTALPELAALFANAAAVISVNTGTMHLASLAGAPTIGLHGATNPLRWGPVGPNSISIVPEQGQYGYLNLGFEYPKNARPAMTHISVETVMQAVQMLINRDRLPS